MSRLATSFVLGYHGCNRDLAQRAVAGEIDLLESDQDFDWLGPGSYFWEADPRRALEWARWKVARGSYPDAAVIGAVIDLRNCLDLISREGAELLRRAYQSFAEVQSTAGMRMPLNKSSGSDPNEDRVLRYLDCAVFRHLHKVIEFDASSLSTSGPFDTVRGMFTEGADLYPGSGFRERSHVQIAVRSKACIRGVFFPRPYPT